MINRVPTTQQVGLVPIDPRSMHVKAYLQLRVALISGVFEPGQTLSIRKVAQMLGTSDMPVRSALGWLVAERGLVQKSNGTFAVPVLGKRQFKEIMELRALLEGRATEQACNHFDESDLTKLVEYADGIRLSIAKADIVAFLNYNYRFKFCIYERCPAPVLRNLIRQLWLQVGPFLYYHAENIGSLSEINFCDDAVKAIQQKQPKQARAAISNDIRSGMKQLLKTLQFPPENQFDDLEASWTMDG